jgi:hypothetical protein
MKLKVKRTERGFAIAEFTDLYGSVCSIQESSLATDDAIWLGVDTHHVAGEVSARMHLNKETAKALIPLLQNFVKTGLLEDRE